MLLSIVTGMSGAGRSLALSKLEDIGFFCVDNLPTALVSSLVNLTFAEGLERVALGLDCREGKCFDRIYDCLMDLKKRDMKTEILFLDAPDETLIRRYKETRRSHPLSRDGSVVTGIAAEREAMHRIKAIADYVIDTGNFKPSDLYARLDTIYGPEDTFAIFVKSFGFKNGLPLDADYVFDTRFIANPYWVEHLRDKTGLDKAVADYVMSDPAATSFIKAALDAVNAALPGFKREGRKMLVIAFGCTGGRHRSVCMAEAFAKLLCGDVSVSHPDMGLK